MMNGAAFHLAAGSVAIACVLAGVATLGMAIGGLITGASRANPVMAVLQSAFGVSLAAVGLQLLSMLHT
ncbi:MAG TPA: hypothetical protein VNX29_01925 [Kaistia sp.]|nr:hypothetical protein [Kaistia sp.]